ncbi:MAG TPA: TIGR03088 family PEP-CTERM/XrtA system glycosyltransferase [Rhodocyclaceae bacterium]|nr:TIGR03088 family PEP-CTERM/XrtA system glycosyltransferase [Rhodocyclaceae bacterium]HUY02635.1 TIGR03088 family PEP-CTERM/XrtA system glycosyltransferase [Rhodocyclaceae bacterium]
MSGSPRDPRPLIAHIVYRFDVGGLENGIVNLINNMPNEPFRHAVIALTEITDFRHRIVREGVSFSALHKPPGHGLRLYPQLYRLFRELQPAIVHTRNLAALEAALPAWAAGVPMRIHGEHGRDIGDLDGSSRKYRWLRRLYRPFVRQYIALSRDLEHYLTSRVGVPGKRVVQIYNGVDATRFHPANAAREPVEGCPFIDPSMWLVGTVIRMQQVKDPLTLTRAFIRSLQIAPALKDKLRLVMVGGGPLRVEVQALLGRAGVADLAWLPGERSDVAAILRGLDCFVLPSLAEGISNTILEAMATGLPVIATRVGGNAELVDAGRTGELVPAADAEALAQRLVDYAADHEAAHAAGRAGRERVERLFSLGCMVQRYQQLYLSSLRAA